MRNLDAPVLAFLIFASIALFPVILLPTSPSMWVAGLSFGYGFGFVLVMAGVAIGVSLPYFVGSLFQLEVHVSHDSLYGTKRGHPTQPKHLSKPIHSSRSHQLGTDVRRLPSQTSDSRHVGQSIHILTSVTSTKWPWMIWLEDLLRMAEQLD